MAINEKYQNENNHLLFECVNCGDTFNDSYKCPQGCWYCICGNVYYAYEINDPSKCIGCMLQEKTIINEQEKCKGCNKYLNTQEEQNYNICSNCIICNKCGNYFDSSTSITKDICSECLKYEY